MADLTPIKVALTMDRSRADRRPGIQSRCVGV